MEEIGLYSLSLLSFIFLEQRVKSKDLEEVGLYSLSFLSFIFLEAQSYRKIHSRHRCFFTVVVHI